jgi:hypothetical protein
VRKAIRRDPSDARDLRTAATRFAESERHGAPHFRPWQALALCPAGARDEALEVVQRSGTAADASIRNWIAGTCAESGAKTTR